MNDRSNRGLRWAILPEKRELTLQDVEGFLLWMPVKRWSALRSNRSLYERKRTSRLLGLDFKNIEVVEYEQHLARARRQVSKAQGLDTPQSGPADWSRFGYDLQLGFRNLLILLCPGWDSNPRGKPSQDFKSCAWDF